MPSLRYQFNITTIALLSFALSLLTLVSSRSLESATFGCSAMDHAACDELCKTDYFWYGHCSAWNGVDFQCKCYEYRAPLNSIVCQNYKDYCNDFCQRKTKENGYCFPSKSTRDPRGEPQCMCFKVLEPFI
uniref:Defensin-like protein n=1 Tax=Panagrellus redivivus TaxID=6233 RepID=A0A7E4V5Q0_PANRE